MDQESVRGAGDDFNNKKYHWGGEVKNVLSGKIILFFEKE